MAKFGSTRHVATPGTHTATTFTGNGRIGGNKGSSKIGGAKIGSSKKAPISKNIQKPSKAPAGAKVK